MSTKQKNVRSKKWDKKDIEKDFLEVDAGNTMRKTAEKYGMSEGALRCRLKMKKEGKSLIGSGRSTVLSPAAEEQLAKSIGTICSLGFSPTREQIKDLVQEYVCNHELRTPFKDGRPGKDWLRAFMARNKLSMKKANMISSARKSATSNPFIIFDFYDVLDKLVKEKKLKASKIWNCDESGFLNDPQKSKVVGVRGKTAYKVTCGAGRENTTTLAVCNATGRILDPLIVFAGKNLD